MTTAYVATIGGHISELVELAGRMGAEDNACQGADEGVWITNDSPQTRDLLAERTVELVPFIAERDHLGVLRSMPQARRLYRRHGVTRVVSTGSAIALGYLPVASLMGIESHYIESSTRVESCSVTGRILSRTPGVNCWWQFENPPDGFSAIEGVYEGFRAVPNPRQPTINRVVVTVGTTDRDFRRLIERLVKIMPEGAEVLWQTGHSAVADLGIEAHRLVPESDLVAAIADADVVVSHAGAGSLSLVLQAGRVPVFVPRRAAFGEQIDDHQVELARWADGRGLAVFAEADQVNLDHLIRAARLQARTRPVGKLVLS
ncbi:MAG: glycosyltransferase [Acidimicrobiales bacterium]